MTFRDLWRKLVVSVKVTQDSTKRPDKKTAAKKVRILTRVEESDISEISYIAVSLISH